MSTSQEKTWDHYTDYRINNLYPTLRKPVADYINHMEQQHGLRLRITATSRTFAEQDELYAVGRTVDIKRKPVTYAKGGESYHNYGLAFDVVPIDVHRQPVWDSPYWERIGAEGERFGFEWGGRWSRPDRPHFQKTYHGYQPADLKKMAESGSKHPSDSRFIDLTFAEDIPFLSPEYEAGDSESDSLNQLTPEILTSLIDQASYSRVPDSTTTLCTLRLHCGFIILGKSACIDPKNFDSAIGEDTAYEDAFRQLWELEGYHQLRSQDAPS